MPAFSFEKIAPPAALESPGPISSPVRRSALVRFLDRLTSLRSQRPEDHVSKAGTLERNEGKQD